MPSIPSQGGPPSPASNPAPDGRGDIPASTVVTADDRIAVKAASFDYMLQYAHKEHYAGYVLSVPGWEEHDIGQRLQHRRVMFKSYSQLNRRDPMSAVEDPETGRPLKILSARIRSCDVTEATVAAGWYSGPVAAAGFDLFLKKIDGQWVVVDVEFLWIS